jgi:hypothetical protein
MVAAIVGHSLISVALFLVMAAATFFLFTYPKSARAFGATCRLCWTAISTPFVFVKNAFVIIGNAQTAEEDYVGTREFVLFRYSRIQYLIICIFAVFFIATSAITAIFAFYPESEIADANNLKQQIASINRDIANTNNNIAAASRPDYTRTLASEMEKSKDAFLRQMQNDATFGQTNLMAGPMRTQIQAAPDVNTLNQLKSQLPTYFSDCPSGPTWTTFTTDQCNQFQQFLANLVDRRTAEANLLVAYQAASKAVADAATALASYKANLGELGGSLTNTQSRYDAVNPANGKWIGRHLMAATGAILSAFIFFIMFVWISSIIVDIVNWTIMMMRSLERRHTETPALPAPSDP